MTAERACFILSTEPSTIKGSWKACRYGMHRKPHLFEWTAVHVQEPDGLAGAFGRDVIDDVTVPPDVGLECGQWLLRLLITPVQGARLSATLR